MRPEPEDPQEIFSPEEEYYSEPVPRSMQAFTTARHNYPGVTPEIVNPEVQWSWEFDTKEPRRPTRDPNFPGLSPKKKEPEAEPEAPGTPSRDP